jgi:hypothetical protein
MTKDALTGFSIQPVEMRQGITRSSNLVGIIPASELALASKAKLSSNISVTVFVKISYQSQGLSYHCF